MIPGGPLAIGAGQLRARNEGWKELVIHGDNTAPLQLHTNRTVDLAPAGIVGGNDDGVLRLCGVVPCDRLNAFTAVLYLANAALLFQHGDACGRLVSGELLYRGQKGGILLAHDLLEHNCPHARVLHLLERLAGLDALMLASVADDEHAVLRTDLVQKVAHLPRAGQ